MIKEFNNETQAKAVADSLGLLMTKYRGVYIVSNSKEEMLAKYNLGYYSGDNIFYDKEVFKVYSRGFLATRDRNIVDASLLELPYDLKDCSYMFQGCIHLEIPPIIPKGVEYCSNMFKGCTSLKKAPTIPKGVKYCTNMFKDCTSLKEAPIIPEGVLECLSTFSGCTSLEIPPKIPEGVQDCSRIFRDCTSLKERPLFPRNCVTTGALLNTPFEEVKL